MSQRRNKFQTTNRESAESIREGAPQNRAYPPDLHPDLRPVGLPHDSEADDARDPERSRSDPGGRTPLDKEPAQIEEESIATLATRVSRLERQNGWLKVATAVLLLIGGYAVADRFLPDGIIVQKTLMESKELKLLDNDGNARMFLRMYSRVPVLQLMDANGKPRMSLGLRFDDTPFIDLSDRRGNTRATFEITEDDSPAMRLFDEDGNTTFKIN